MATGGYVAFDLDGTLAHYDHWRGPDHIGIPIPNVVQMVKDLLAEGTEVRIFTARVCEPQDGYSVEQIAGIIQDWTEKHIGVRLPVTNAKDFQMIRLFDDRAIQVETNSGRLIVDSVWQDS